MKKEFNGQTYECPVHGLITGDQVGEEEVDYGILRHWCHVEIGNGKHCYQSAPYVGFRKTPKSKPVRTRPHYIDNNGKKVYLS